MIEYTVTFKSDMSPENVLGALSWDYHSPLIIESRELYEPQDGDVIVSVNHAFTYFRSGGKWSSDLGPIETGDDMDEDFATYISEGHGKLVFRDGKPV